MFTLSIVILLQYTAAPVRTVIWQNPDFRVFTEPPQLCYASRKQTAIPPPTPPTTPHKDRTLMASAQQCSEDLAELTVHISVVCSEELSVHIRVNAACRSSVRGFCVHISVNGACGPQGFAPCHLAVASPASIPAHTPSNAFAGSALSM